MKTSSKKINEEINVHLGKRIRRRRRLLGLTQQQLAETIGIRFQQIQKYECANNQVSAARLLDIANALAVSPEYFYSGLTRAAEIKDSETSTLCAQIADLDVATRRKVADWVNAHNGIAPQ